MIEFGKESLESVNRDIRQLHSYHWSRFWKGVDVGHFAEVFQNFTAGLVKWDGLFYVLDGGIGFSITGSDWFQRLIGISDKLEVKSLAVATRAYAILNALLPIEYPMEIISKLCDCIWKKQTKTSENPSWSSGFKWRTSTGYVVNKDEPSSLVTALVGLAFLDTYKLSKDTMYLDRAKGIARYFILENGYKVFPNNTICYNYTPNMQELITNASAFVALFLKSLSIATGDQSAVRDADRAFRFIINNQGLDGSWQYFPSPKRKVNIIDNYHTGFVLEALLEGLDLEYNRDIDLCVKNGLRFYASMFRRNGQPIFNVRRNYPIDIHDAAQGIIVFSQAQRIFQSGGHIADQIRNFVNLHMKRSDGRYISRIYRFGRSNLITPRWADCWMMLGLAEFLRAST